MNIISGALQPELGAIEFDGDVGFRSMSPEAGRIVGNFDFFSASGHPRRSLGARKSSGRSAGVGVRRKLAPSDAARAHARRGRPARPACAPRRLADGRAEAPAGDRQGPGDQAEGADPRRAHRFPRSSIRPTCFSTASGRSSRTGTSVIYITHRLAELRQIAQRVTVLRDGRSGAERWSSRSAMPSFLA